MKKIFLILFGIWLMLILAISAQAEPVDIRKLY